MKTIATVAVLLMVAAPAWSDDTQSTTKNAANSNEPIVLSEAEMDGVTAGRVNKIDSFSIKQQTITSSYGGDYFSDVNGDGRVDFVSAGTVY